MANFKLPDNLAKWIDGSSDGIFIYFFIPTEAFFIPTEAGFRRWFKFP